MVLKIARFNIGIYLVRPGYGDEHRLTCIDERSKVLIF